MKNKKPYYILGSVLCLFAAAFVIIAYPNKAITLNSSPYGLPFYQSLGFHETDAEQTVNGIRFTPVKYLR